MIGKLNDHYSFTNPATVHDEEALTTLELVGRTTAKLNEVVASQNEVVEDVEYQKQIVIPETIKNDVQNHIEKGTFDKQIDEHTQKLLNQIAETEESLGTRLDNLLGSVTEGSTTGDAELIDGRVSHDGVVYENLGTAVRTQTKTNSDKINNLDTFKRVNLIRDIVKGEYISGNGTIYSDVGFSRTTPIYLTAGSHVYSTYEEKLGSNRNCFMVVGDTFSPLSPVLTEDAYSKYEIPENGYYVFNTKLNGGCVCYNVNDLGYFNRGVYLPDVITEKVEGFQRVNLVAHCENGFLNVGVISTAESNRYCHSNPIFLKAGETVYTVHYNIYGVNTHLWMVQADGTPLYQKAEKVNTGVEEYNEYHIEVTGYYSVNGANGYACMVRNAEDLNAPMGCYIPDDCLNVISVLNGKSISFNGDSICAGAGHSGGYGKIIADNHNMVYENIGVGGATITAEQYRSDNGSARHWICRTIANMNVGADYIIVQGGVNDSSLGVPLGTISEGYDTTLDDTTFYGAFESMCKQLVTTFAGKKIGYIFVHKITSGFSSIGGSYYAAAKECCEKWGVPYLDLNVECPPLNHIPSLKSTYTKDGDGWHPNEEGYKKYYVPKITAFLERL